MLTRPTNRAVPPTGTSRHTLFMTLRTAAGSAGVGYVVNLALLPFVIHRLGPDLYGAWITVASLLAVGGLADAGVRLEIIRRVGDAQGDKDDEGLVRSVHQGLTLLAAVAAAFLVVGLIGAPLIRAIVFPAGVTGYSAASIDWLIRLTFVLLAASLLGKGYCGAARGVQRGDVEMVAEAMAVPIGAVVIIGAVLAGWGIWAMLFGAAAELFVTVGWQYLRLRRLVPALRPGLARMSRVATRSYLALSGLVFVGQLSDVVDSQWDKLVLSHFVGSAAVASFQVGTSLVLQGKALVVVPLAPLLVVVSELRNRDDAKMESYFRVLARTGMVLAAVVLGGIFVFAPSFVRLWLGSGVPAAGHAARLFAVAAVFGMFSAPLSFRALAEGWHSLVAIGAVVNMVVNGALSLVLTIWLGFNGPLYGSIAGNLAGTVVFLILMRRRLGPRWTPLPVGALAVGIIGAVLALVSGVDGVASWPALIAAATGWTVLIGLGAIAAERLPITSLFRPGIHA